MPSAGSELASVAAEPTTAKSVAAEPAAIAKAFMTPASAVPIAAPEGNRPAETTEAGFIDATPADREVQPPVAQPEAATKHGR
ncbi:MAG TPA: hypothetical protein VKT78_06905, partial [Fimbriimonadaceae bacterium]|nr:hypothetical protein [Fimbriimonadaceae bacterium]